MSPDKIRPELRKAITSLPSLPFNKPKLLPLARILYNLAARSKIGSGVSVSILKNGSQSIRVYRPDDGKTDAGVLWAFGGGHVAGKPAHVNALASKIAAKTGANVFVPEYRLAPKHPFPADLDDCFAAWNWMLDNRRDLGLNPNRLVIGGNSAGGGIAAALAQRILDKGGAQPRAQILFYPMLDDRISANRELDKGNHFIWSNTSNYVAWSAYLAPAKPGDESLPSYASPARREDLSGLPPAWVGVGDVDLFAKEDIDYANNLKSEGIECQLEIVKGAPHAFEAIAPGLDVSKAFVDSAIMFMKEKLV